MSSNVTRKRTELILALAANGLTHEAIAKQVGCSTKTVQRHVAVVKPALDAVSDINTRASNYIEQVLPVEKRIDEYISMLDVAKATKQPSAGGAILTRLDEMNGMVSEKERNRSKNTTPSEPQAMFMLPPGASVSVTVSNYVKPVELPQSGSVIDVKSEGENRS